MASVFNDMVYTAAPTVAPSSAPTSVKVASDVPAPAAEVKPDTVELSSAKKEKKGPIKALKGFVGGVKKFFASAGAYTKGAIKGVGTGAVAGSLVYTAGKIINKFSKSSKKVPSAIIGGIVAAGALAINLWNASLNATQKNSEIDLRYEGLKNKK